MYGVAKDVGLSVVCEVLCISFVLLSHSNLHQTIDAIGISDVNRHQQNHHLDS
jgi:hypothetical protein